MNTLRNKEIKILDSAIKAIEKKKGKRLVESEENKKIINILEKFLKRKKLICYGGTAINNIIPDKDKFYNKNIELPDYDFFSKNALNDAKELADIYFKENYQEVEAKAGLHPGTFKLFVNFKAIADITQLDSTIYSSIKKESIIKDNIYYAPANFLRMSMYLELSRPDGDISRWEKVLPRLILLNKHYPLKGIECNTSNFERQFTGPEDKKIIYNIIKEESRKLKLVFFGGYSLSLYSSYYKKTKLQNNPDFDLLSLDPLNSAKYIKTKLDNIYNNVNIVYHNSIGENIPYHYEIKIGDDTIAFIYKTEACYSYNNLKVNNKTYRIATIDTLLSFYLAFYYTKLPYYDKNRILCIAEFLFKVQQKNRLSQKGILKRFSSTCYGKQKSIEEIRREKNIKYNVLKTQKRSKDYEYNFLKYNPNLDYNIYNDKISNVSLRNKTIKNKK